MILHLDDNHVLLVERCRRAIRSNTPLSYRGIFYRVLSFEYSSVRGYTIELQRMAVQEMKPR